MLDESIDENALTSGLEEIDMVRIWKMDAKVIFLLSCDPFSNVSIYN